MISYAARLGHSWLLRRDPETAHRLSIHAMRLGAGTITQPHHDPRLALRFAGLELPNPVGLAAGYDKDGEIVDGMLRLGFGFVEAGTVTPRPQAGNPRPRLFRLGTDHAIINRMGFNNQGYDRILDRLKRRKDRAGIVGINIGANHDSPDRIADYTNGIFRFAEKISYLTLNISSPNTVRLRSFHEEKELARLLTGVTQTLESCTRRVPVFLKIAPDLDDKALDGIAKTITKYPIDGLIVSNTSLSRHGLRNRDQACEAGGLSGRPLFFLSTVALAKMRLRLGPDFPIIGVGGIDSADSALEKIRAGADAVQLYTGLVYQGPMLVRRVLTGLSRYLDANGLACLRVIRDQTSHDWANRATGETGGLTTHDMESSIM